MLALLTCAGIVSYAETIVDLTHAFDERTIYWPTEPGFVLEKGPAGFTERGYFYAANRFAAPEHGGTHIDAPISTRRFTSSRRVKRSIKSPSRGLWARAFVWT
jgi:hypothetical protein